MSVNTKILNVDLGDKSYPIYIGTDLLSSKSVLTKHIQGKQVMIVTNTTIAPLYLEKLKAVLEGFNVESVVLPDGEKFKTLETLNKVFDALMKAKFDRTSTLVALGIWLGLLQPPTKEGLILFKCLQHFFHKLIQVLAAKLESIMSWVKIWLVLSISQKQSSLMLTH
jgi:hypothetical protein